MTEVTMIERITSAYEAYGRGDTIAFVELIDPDLEWTYLDPSEEDPEPQVCHGRDQLITWMQRQSERGLRSVIEEAEEYGDRVLIMTHTPGIKTARLRPDGERSYFVLTILANHVVALRACRSREEALAIVTPNDAGSVT